MSLSPNRGSADHRALALLSVSHMFNDVNQGAIPALLPFLIAAHSLSYTAASGVVLAATLVSSLVQPLLGLCSDRKPLPWLMPAGVFAGGMGIACVGLAEQYTAIIAAALLSGIGVAAFHPESSRYANYISGRKATGMSFFTVGGTIGFALGPLMMTPLASTFGLKGTVAMALPAVAVTLALIWKMPSLTGYRPSSASTAMEESPDAQWSAFIRVVIVIVLRVAVYFGLMSFIPLYFIGVRGASIVEGNSALSVMLVAGCFGAVMGGYVADRMGLKTVLAASLAAIPPLTLFAVWLPGAGGIVAIAALGIAVLGSSAVAVVMGQSYLRCNLGAASGIILGSAIGLGGVAVPILGLIADRWGLPAAMYTTACIPIPALILALTLPSPERCDIVS